MTQVGAHDLMMQLIWCALGFVLCVAATALDYQWLKKIAVADFHLRADFAACWCSCPHIGHASHGAHRWFAFRGVHFQPSEFGKIALDHHARMVLRPLPAADAHVETRHHFFPARSSR